MGNGILFKQSLMDLHSCGFFLVFFFFPFPGEEEGGRRKEEDKVKEEVVTVVELPASVLYKVSVFSLFPRKTEYSVLFAFFDKVKQLLNNLRESSRFYEFTTLVRGGGFYYLEYLGG